MIKIKHVKKQTKILQLVAFITLVLLFSTPVDASGYIRPVELNGDATNGYYVNMSSMLNDKLTVSEDVKTFKIYDIGGAEQNYSNSSSCSLLISAPEGQVINLSGIVTTEDNYWDYLTIYDGGSTDSPLLGAKKRYGTPEGEIIETLTSSTNQVTLYFRSNSSNTTTGLDLTATIGNPSQSYDITTQPVSNGSVQILCDDTEITSAVAGKTITVVGQPEEGYILTSIQAVNSTSGTITTIGGTWHDNNTATFIMPASAVNIKITFEKLVSGEDGLYQNIPVYKTTELTLAKDVQQIKIYDNGGPDADYSNYCKGSLLLSAPKGYRIKLTGTVTTNNAEVDYLTIYDGENKESATLGNSTKLGGPDELNIGTIISTGETILLSFTSDHYLTGAGLDLTAKVICSNHVTETQNAKKATCKEEGYSGDICCTQCNEIIEYGNVIPKSATHTWDLGTITKEPTYLEQGETSFNCLICAATKTAAIDKLICSNHITEIRNAKEATCKDDGYTGDTCCTQCNEIIEHGNIIPKSTTHTWNSGTITKEPTYQEQGELTFCCLICNTTKIEMIAKLEAEHEQNPPTEEDTPPNTDTNGDLSSKDDSTSDTANNNNMDNIKINDVIKIEKVSYRITNLKKRTVTYLKTTSKSKTIHIPSTIKIYGTSFKVTQIANNAFKNNKKIKKVVIGNNIKTIGKNAFRNCKRLKTVTIESKVLYKIGANAFYGDKKLTKITLKTTKLKKSSVGKNALKGTNKKLVIKAPRKKKKAYKTYFRKKGNSAVTIK